MLRQFVASIGRSSSRSLLAKPISSTNLSSFRCFYPKNSTPNRTLTGEKAERGRNIGFEDAEAKFNSSVDRYFETGNKESYSKEEKRRSFWLTFDFIVCGLIVFCFYTIRKEWIHSHFSSNRADNEKEAEKKVQVEPVRKRMVKMDRSIKGKHTSSTAVFAELPHISGTPEFNEACHRLESHGINVEESRERGVYAFSYTIEQPTRREVIEREKEIGKMLLEEIDQLQKLEKAAASR